jgi:ATP-dependent DNA helicase PIF1
MDANLNAKQREAFQLAREGHNLFVCSAGGTGKSFLIKCIKEEFEAHGKIVAVTALTGVAASLINGTTIHRWAGIRLGELPVPAIFERVRKSPGAKNWKQTHLLIIDEISMLTPDLLDKLNAIAQNLRWSRSTFGGLQLILMGDLCQLPPVATDVLCIKATCWDSLRLKLVYLTENMRQADPIFQQILSEVRMGIVSDLCRETLGARVGAKIGTDEIKPTKLFSDRLSVDDINQKELHALVTKDNPLRPFKGADFIESREKITKKQQENWLELLNKSCPAKAVLEFCIGAQVMLTWNIDVAAGLTNGSRGVIVRFEEQRPVVKFLNGIEMIIQQQRWDVLVSREDKVSRMQLPLMLAWGSTIHKAQGSTLDLVEINLGCKVFCFGQFYTALSRARSLEGLSISELDFDGVKVDPEAEKFYKSLMDTQ